MGLLDSVGQWLELIFCHLSNPAQEKTLNLSVSKDGKWPKCRTAMQAITQIFCRGAQIGVIVFACIALSRIDPGEDSAHKSVFGEFDSSFQVQGYALDPDRKSVV